MADEVDVIYSSQKRKAVLTQSATASGATPPAGTSTDPVFVSSSSSPAPSATATPAAVAATTTATTLLSANSARRGATIYYDGPAILYVLFGSGTASATNYVIKLGSGLLTYFEVPFGFTGKIVGVWSAASGTAYIDELTA